MPTTNYYTVNGRIRGEATDGVFRPYGPDALGSVVATYDSTGAPENTYRNAPYGTQVAKTRATADPKFLWNGSAGYRGTARSFCDAYVRSRHVAEGPAQWTSADRLWPQQRIYCYAGCRPSCHNDPSGDYTSKAPAVGPGLPFNCSQPGLVFVYPPIYVPVGVGYGGVVTMQIVYNVWTSSHKSFSAITDSWEYLQSTKDLTPPKKQEHQGWNHYTPSMDEGIALFNPGYRQDQADIFAIHPVDGWIGNYTDIVDWPSFEKLKGGSGVTGTACVCQIYKVSDGCGGPPAAGVTHWYIAVQDGNLVSGADFESGSADCDATCAREIQKKMKDIGL